MANQYTVANGDTLSSIGAKYGVSYQEIAKANNVADPNKIYPGQTFMIPDKPGTVPAAQPQQQPQAQPQAQPTFQPQPVQSQPQPSGGGDTELQQLAKTNRNPVQETRYQELLKSQGGSGSTGGVPTMTPQPTINLQALYDKYNTTPEMTAKQAKVTQLQQDLSQKEKDKNAALAIINDNPFLSEGTRVGRVDKTEKLYEDRTANLQKDIQNATNDVATSKADAETRLNLELKQFDINSQQAQQALTQFNQLLSMGALDNASGEDIANITRSTGLSSTAINSAIKAVKDSKKKDVKTQVITSTNDAGVVTATVIDSETGKIIAKNDLGKIGNAEKGTKATKAEEDTQNRNNMITSIKNYNDLKSIMGAFSGVFTPDEIYQLYNMYSPFGPANESIDEIKQGLFSTK
jgi:murein DD-endopeptidase MepM/ murein hydrolase activator NlpD